MRKIKILLVLLVCQFFWLTIDAQTNVTGQVLSSDKGQPLSDASVIVNGDNSGTRTDADGRFSINTTIGKSVVFSFIGYKSKVILIKKRSLL